MCKTLTTKYLDFAKGCIQTALDEINKETPEETEHRIDCAINHLKAAKLMNEEKKDE